MTTTNRHYFTDDELAGATVIELPLDETAPAGPPAAAPPDARQPSCPDRDA